MALAKLLDLVTGSALKKRSWQEICHDLSRLKDEASVLRLAEELLSRYDEFDEDAQFEFFSYLLNEFRVDQQRLEAAIHAYLEENSPLNVQAINRASQPARRSLFEIINMCPRGTQHLLEMRVALKRHIKREPELQAVDSDLETLFLNWFNRGFLTLKKIDWTTPSFILEKLIKYEAVHEITGWDDLERRVSTGRRCYAFFHPALPDEPIIFVQVALVKGLASSIGHLLAEDAQEQMDEGAADTAIFYSISNCQQGLVGVAFGDMLIKQVAERITRNNPQIRRFATLSPVPGFNRWLRQSLNGETLTEEEQTIVEACLSGETWDTAADTSRDTLTSLCAHYLINEKRGAAPLDPVARFHLRNGAHLERINWLGDPSPKGMRESSGILVNYVYDLVTVTKNHEAYVYENDVACSSAITQLARR